MKKKNNYWTLDTEKAIIDYNMSESMEERNKLFDSIIYPALKKLVENIFNRFKFNYMALPNEQIQIETVNYIAMQLDKFNPTLGFKSFSYFSIAVKNYLIQLSNNNLKRFNQYESFDIPSEGNFSDNSNPNPNLSKVVINVSINKYNEELLSKSHDTLLEFYDLVEPWWNIHQEELGKLHKNKFRNYHKLLKAIIQYYVEDDNVGIHGLLPYLYEKMGTSYPTIHRMRKHLFEQNKKLYEYYKQYKCLPDDIQFTPPKDSSKILAFE